MIYELPWSRFVVTNCGTINISSFGVVHDAINCRLQPSSGRISSVTQVVHPEVSSASAKLSGTCVCTGVLVVYKKSKLIIFCENSKMHHKRWM